MARAPRSSPSSGTSTSRDDYVDVLRAFSLFVVVLWHWVFSVVAWAPDGPHASNPIGTTRALWLMTWLLQVMPVFFFVGGFSHLATWRSVQGRGEGYATFVRRRLGRLLGPTTLCVAFVAAVWVALEVFAPGITWTGRGLLLLVSPLWFLAVYVVLVLLAPLTIRAHDRGGEVVLVVLAGAAVWVDLGRFRYGVEELAWLNMVVVWGLVHQLGYFYERLRDAPARTQWSLALGGLMGLTALTNMGLYPRSMVGVPGEQISNMAPPTLTIVVLALFQVGVVGLLRPAVLRWLERPAARKVVVEANTLAMTVFLWHLTGYAVAYGLLRLAGLHAPEDTTLAWWAQRPLWLVAPAVATIPLVVLFRRFDGRQTRNAAAPGRPSGGQSGANGNAGLVHRGSEATV